MVVDKNGIGHAFCISESQFILLKGKLTVKAHSETMAEKVAPWIKEIIAVSQS